MKYTDYNKVNRNLYRYRRKYYRLTGYGITPNGCWIINSKMQELIDIDIASGQDINGKSLELDGGVTGTVNAYNEYIVV